MSGRYFASHLLFITLFAPSKFHHEGKFSAPMDGLYHFEFHVMFRRGASASPVVDLMKNGKSLASAWRTQRNRWVCPAVSDPVC